MTDQIVLAGASGLIGSKVVSLLPGGGFEVHVLSRRKLERMPTGVLQHIADPVEWPAQIAGLKPTVAISCLGTTWNKSGKNEAAFRAVDLKLVLAFAAAARKAGARHMISVSSVGASAKSAGFYLRTKGEMENGLKQLGFQRLDILRPGLLIGERGGERRLGERIEIVDGLPVIGVSGAKEAGLACGGVNVARGACNAVMDEVLDDLVCGAVAGCLLL